MEALVRGLVEADPNNLVLVDGLTQNIHTLRLEQPDIKTALSSLDEKVQTIGFLRLLSVFPFILLLPLLGDVLIVSWRLQKTPQQGG